MVLSIMIGYDGALRKFIPRLLMEIHMNKIHSVGFR